MSSMMTSRKVISANMMNNANDDLSLVSQAAVFHDRQAFGKLVVRYQSPIRRFFLHLTAGDASLSDDLAQDTFVKAFLNIERFRGASAFSTWLYRIAYNVFFDYTRRHRPNDDIEPTEALEHRSSDTDHNARMDVYDALRRLGEKERTCVTLQLVDGYPLEDIARITGMAVGTVKSHLFRGKQKLTTFLKNNGYEGNGKK